MVYRKINVLNYTIYINSQKTFALIITQTFFSTRKIPKLYKKIKDCSISDLVKEHISC